MRSITRPLVFVSLVVSFCLMWMAHTDRDVVVAQTRKPIMMTRIYTGPDGLSHAEEIEMKRRLYFGKGALEFWYCDEHGKMSFFKPRRRLERSELCRKFPANVVPHDRGGT